MLPDSHTLMRTWSSNLAVPTGILAICLSSCASDLLIDLNEPGPGSEEWCEWQSFHHEPLEDTVRASELARLWERRLGSDTLGGRWSHQAALAPGTSELRMGHRGLLIGFDLGDRAEVEGNIEGALLSELGLDLRGRRPVDQAITVNALMTSSHRSLPTHVLEFGTGAPGDVEGPNDLLWSLYDEDPAFASPIERSRLALDEILDERIEQAFFEDRPTHVLLLASGWNTTQLECVRDHAAMLQHLEAAMGEDFRPLVLTFTWPSRTTHQEASQDRIALERRRIADEVGLLWVNRILHRSVLPQAAANGNVPVVLIGHSLGARMLSRAAYAGSMLAGPAAGQRADLLICLSAAFSMRRFDPRELDRGEGAPYAYPADGPKHVVLVSSARDAVSDWPDQMWLRQERDAVGGMHGWDHASELLNTLGIERRPVYPDGRFRLPLHPAPAMLAVDATRLIGCHDDVVRLEHGRMLGTLIDMIRDPDGAPKRAPGRVD